VLPYLHHIHGAALPVPTSGPMPGLPADLTTNIVQTIVFQQKLRLSIDVAHDTLFK
jgi:hypothetical protein